MESEEFYDSLDDSEYDSLENSFQKEYLEKNSTMDIETDTSVDDDVIPFYDKQLTKSQVELCKKSSKASTVTNKGTSRKKPKPRIKIPVTTISNQKISSKSYLDLFYARIGAESTDSVSSRVTCADLSSRSYESCGSKDDIDSVYFKTQNSESSYASTNQDLALSLTSIVSNLRSVSEQNMDRKSCHSKIRSNSKLPIKKVTELGKLGPDISIDKLELYKRRQQYGKKASQTNVIKMLEKKTLQNLEREIRKSKIYT